MTNKKLKKVSRDFVIDKYCYKEYVKEKEEGGSFTLIVQVNYIIGLNLTSPFQINSVFVRVLQGVDWEAASFDLLGVVRYSLLSG